MPERDFISTRDVAPGQRLDYWNGFIERFFPGMSVSSSNEIEATWEARTIGELRVCRARSEKSLVQRWKTEPGESESGRTVVHLQSQGASLTCQEDAAVLTNSGDLTFCDSASPYEINISDRNVMTVIDFPRAFLAEDLPAGVLCSASIEPARRLHEFAWSILDDDLSELQDEDRSEECILDVFATLLRACVHAESEPGSDELLESRRIFEYIDRSIENSALRTKLIADRLALSPKRVQRIFAKIGTTPSQFILKKRVNLAALMLRSRSFDGTITDLAMDTGFSDTAHLCRSFKNHFGMTPREYGAAFQRRGV